MQNQINELIKQNLLMKEKLDQTERMLKDSQNALLEQFAARGQDFGGMQAMK